LQEPVAPALRNAYRAAWTALRLGRAVTAERQVRAILATAPGETHGLHLLGAALLAQGKVTPAIEALEQVVASRPQHVLARIDLARAYRESERFETALQMLRPVLEQAPSLFAWRAYADVLFDLGKYPDACFAFQQARLLDPERARIEKATVALVSGDRQAAESLFREVLKADPAHVAALTGLAALALGAAQTEDAERLLRHARKQTAHDPLVQRGLVHTLVAAARLLEAERAARDLLKIEPENPQNWVALGTVYTSLLRQSEALDAYEQALRLNPKQVSLQLSIGHLNKTLGRREACERAYQECLLQDPSCAEAYWSLADLKNYTFTAAELAAMRALLERPSADAGAQAQLRFALGRALEQRGDYREAFVHYAAGNILRRQQQPFDIGKFEKKTRRVATCFNRQLFEEKRGAGEVDRSPIFIVGLPRSGSTLIEQILASHSQVEGTMELANILTQVREFDQLDGTGDGYPESVRAASPEKLTALGRRYLEETRPLRTGKPRFIDKMPNNLSHIGLIHLILPNATVIDARRHPMDACFSTYKQHFAQGQAFSYDLADLGRYYRCYLALMDHWDEVLPGKVLHVQYEQLVRNPEKTIRLLLAHCSLPFESACLAFHETRRPVRTASAEQVRQPLYTSGIGYWKNFASELGDLQASLGDCLERFASLDGCGDLTGPLIERH